MKTSTGSLASWLPTATARLKASLLTITLSGGSVLRYHDSDVATITYDGHTYTRGPRFNSNGIKSKVGVQVDEVRISFIVDANDTVSGVPWLTFISGSGLDGATFEVNRITSKGPDFSAANLIGGFLAFSGRFAGVDDLGQTLFTVISTAWTELLDAAIPIEVYQSSCRFALYDAGCGVDRASFTSTGAVASGSTTSVVNTNLTDVDDYFSLGVIVFTSGANDGLRRTIKSFTHTGGVVGLVVPLPTAPSNGDTFSIYPGCDRTLETCETKFSNRLRHGGQEFIPDPTMAV